MTQEEKAEGIVLRAFDYKDRQRIITVFTQESGIISLIIKGISKKNFRLLSLSTPFSQVEVHFKKGKTDLFRYVDGTIIDEHLRLREQYAYLQTAGGLAQAILQSQLPGKPAPSLYLLFRSFLKQVPLFDNHATLLASFRLKLLRHEGLLALSPECTHCTDAPARYLLQGESVCALHQAPSAIAFNEEEWGTLNHLESTQQFSKLRSLHIPPHFPDLIAAYFRDRLRQD
ncbi:MAG: DNA repair protein RecO [Verrucomicrobia bacterium]|nr:DNA repair protein RecO [Verrucomicrobiota bacterium]